MSSSPPTTTLLTPPGKGGIAVVSVEGDNARQAVSAIFHPITSADAKTGQLQLGKLVIEGETLDEALVAWTAGGAELHLHGGPLIVQRLLTHLSTSLPPSVIPSEVEGSGSSRDVPDPSTSLGMTPGQHLAHPRWDNPAIGEDLMETLPQAESLHVASVLSHQWSAGLSELVSRASVSADELRAAADGFAVVQKLLHPPEVVLAGPPNAGKSTLMNRLVGRPVSIVHAQAGTTRDWVREKALLSGVPVWLTDTAGLWDDAEHPVDIEAVRRAWDRIEQADLVLLVSDGEALVLPEHLEHVLTLCVKTKWDGASVHNGRPGGAQDGRCLSVSAHTDVGIPSLCEAILGAIQLNSIDPTTPRAFTARQRDLLIEAAEAVSSRDAISALLR